MVHCVKNIITAAQFSKITVQLLTEFPALHGAVRASIINFHGVIGDHLLLPCDSLQNNVFKSLCVSYYYICDLMIKF